MDAEKLNTVRLQFAKILTEVYDEQADGILATTIFLADLIMNATGEDETKSRAMITLGIIPGLNKAISKRAGLMKAGNVSVAISKPEA